MALVGRYCEGYTSSFVTRLKGIAAKGILWAQGYNRSFHSSRTGSPAVKPVLAALLKRSYDDMPRLGPRDAEPFNARGRGLRPAGGRRTLGI